MKLTDWQAQKEAINIGLATDHGGWALKSTITTYLKEKHHCNVVDFGPFTQDDQDDYPDFAAPCCRALSRGELDCALLICRSGVGMGIVANRYPNVRAVVAYFETVAQASRDHNCSNVLVLPADYIDQEKMFAVIDSWFAKPFSGGARHARRIMKIDRNLDAVGVLRRIDPELAQVLGSGRDAAMTKLNLVASENVCPEMVRAAMSCFLTDKYAEGNVGERLYPDCSCADAIEQLCIDRACALFGAEAANVQPYSGSVANLAVYHALLHTNETVMALHPARGGHSTHFSQMNISGRFWTPVYYDLDPETEQINYDDIEKLAIGCRPKMIVAGGSGYPRTFDFARLRAIADKINALLMVDMAHYAGLIAAKLYPNPVPFADVVTSTTHKTLRGPRGGLILCKKEYISLINQAVFPLIQGGPLMHVIASKAIAFKEAQTAAFVAYQKSVLANARALCEEFKKRGLPIVTGSTDSHMGIVDITSFGLDAKAAAQALEQAGINVNAARLPKESLRAETVGGIRFGTSDITTRGLTEKEMPQIVAFICDVLRHASDNAYIQKKRAEIANYCESLYR